MGRGGGRIQIGGGEGDPKGVQVGRGRGGCDPNKWWGGGGRGRVGSK